MNQKHFPFSSSRRTGSLRSFAELLDESVRRYPHKLALIDGNRHWSYSAFNYAVWGAARGLAAAGTRAGDRIALHMLNRLELAVLYFACARLGAISVPINTRLKPPEVDFVLRHSAASIYIGTQELMPTTVPEFQRAKALKRIFLLDSSGGPEGTLAYESLFTAGSTLPLQHVDPSEPANIIYTSGSTAQPKGVVHNHNAIISAAKLGRPGILGDSVIAQATSMMHSGGFSNLIASVHVGATLVLLPAFDADEVLDAIEQHRCTYFFGLPFMFEALVERQLARPRDVTSTSIFHVAGDTVSPTLQSRFEAVFNHPLHEYYGSTEAGRVTHQPPGRPVRTGSIGLPIDGIEVKIINNQDREAPIGTAGELLIKTPAAMSGYWQDPEATAEVLRDGWIYSGDFARRDADGYIWFLGRKKEIIVHGGSNISPQEVESVLAGHPAVLESGVFGLPDPVLGERVAAVVHSRRDIHASETELIAFLRARLADYKVPERIWFRGPLPKSAGGKLQRGLLREEVLAGFASSRSG
jgi:long-chain acyl-CoA synthetase